MDSNKLINTLFDRLDCWRHLPAYQLERRADIFFSLYLKDVLEIVLKDKYGETIALLDSIIPEFPIRKETADENHQSNKVDYVLFKSDFATAYFVELKTEWESVDKKQIDYLKKAKRDGNDGRERNLQEHLQNLLQIAPFSKAAGKYCNLLRELVRLKFLHFDSDKEGQDFPIVNSPNELSQLCKKIHVARKNCSIEVVYISPTCKEQDDLSSSFRRIYFDDFIEHLRKQDDYLSLRFANSLEEWKKRAGSPAC